MFVTSNPVHTNFALVREKLAGQKPKLCWLFPALCHKYEAERSLAQASNDKLGWARAQIKLKVQPGLGLDAKERVMVEQLAPSP